MTTHYKLSTSAVRRLALVSLAACLAWPVANAQTTQPGMGAMKPGMAASAPMGAGHMTGSGHMGMKGMTGAGHMGMKGMMGSMSDKMAAMPMTGNADVDFAAMMRIHHLGAIDMAEAELKDGKNAEMRTMAKNIVAAQQKEIAQLEKFLAAQGHPVDKTKAK